MTATLHCVCVMRNKMSLELHNKIQSIQQLKCVRRSTFYPRVSFLSAHVQYAQIQTCPQDVRQQQQSASCAARLSQFKENLSAEVFTDEDQS